MGHYLTRAAQDHADSLVCGLIYLLRATEDGGQASELHLGAILGNTVTLLKEVGGFEDVLAKYPELR